MSNENAVEILLIEDNPNDAWAYPAVSWVQDQALLTYFNYTGGHALQLRRLPAAWFYEKPALPASQTLPADH